MTRPEPRKRTDATRPIRHRKKPRPFQRKGTEGRDCRSPQSGYARLARRLAPNNGNEPTKTNVFAKPNGQNRACASYAMARKRLLKTNVFVKPNEQSRACASYVMARKRLLKTKLFYRYARISLPFPFCTSPLPGPDRIAGNRPAFPRDGTPSPVHPGAGASHRAPSS